MEEQPKVGPTVLGKLVLFLFVLACIAGAAYYFRDLLAPGGAGDKQVNLDDFKKVEAPDTKGITTVQEYKYVPGEKLPPVKGVSAYKWDPAQKTLVPVPGAGGLSAARNTHEAGYALDWATNIWADTLG